jgi:hypothetical protein
MRPGRKLSVQLAHQTIKIKLFDAPGQETSGSAGASNNQDSSI